MRAGLTDLNDILHIRADCAALQFIWLDISIDPLTNKGVIRGPATKGILLRQLRSCGHFYIVSPSSYDQLATCFHVAKNASSGALQSIQ